jgi:hypothetical protein
MSRTCQECAIQKHKNEILIQKLKRLELALKEITDTYEEVNDFEIVETSDIPYDDLYAKEKDGFECQNSLNRVEEIITTIDPIKSKVDTTIDTVLGGIKYLGFFI